MKPFAILQGLGWPGIVGIGLLVFSVIFYAMANAPARAERDGFNAERDRLMAAAQAGQRQQSSVPAAQSLPSFTQAPELLKQLHALAQKDGVEVTRSSYQVRNEDSTKVFEVDLPLKVAYPMLRTYLRDVLALSPTARLDDLNLHRGQASDPAIDADVRLSFAFAAAS